MCRYVHCVRVCIRYIHIRGIAIVHSQDALAGVQCADLRGFSVAATFPQVMGL